MLTLDAEFEKSNGRKQHLRLKDFNPNKTAEEIKTSLGKLTQLSLFDNDGVGLYKKVKHAKIIEKVETPIFDKDSQEAEEMDKQLANEMDETTPTAAIAAQDAENIRIPEDLKITELCPESDVLIQTIELPIGVDPPREMNENQAMLLITACLPENASLEGIQIDESTSLPKIILTESVIEAAPTQIVTESSPEKPKQKRKRLLDRVRKRE